MTTGPKEMRAMLQTLLQERFHLQVHREKRIFSSYLLNVSKRGAQLRPSSEPERGLRSIGGAESVRVSGSSATMESLANRLALDLGRPVFDKTGITGTWRIELQWAREGNGPSVFGALEEQLGLRLEATKMPLNILVIDSTEKTPDSN